MAVTAPAADAVAATAGVCDLYAAGGTPCIGAHSTTRALFGSYSGPLYQVQRASDRAFADVGLLSAGGVANAAAQDSFCAATSCTITKIYDQTANHNDLPISWGGFWKGPGPNGADVGADAKALPLTVGGQPAYGIKVTQGVGYRVDNARNAPTGAHPEGIYMVTSSNFVDQWCCFDYGSGENSHTDTGNATMNAIEWGTACWFGGCVGTGPWVEADLENGMYHTNTGSNKDPNNSGVHFPFVSAWEKNNGTSNFTLKYGNANSGGLTTTFSGPLPNGYSPMRTDSSLLLGTGGDNSVTGVGYFFEGAVTVRLSVRRHRERRAGQHRGRRLLLRQRRWQQSNVRAGGRPVRPVPRRHRPEHRQRRPGPAVGLLRQPEPAVDLHLGQAVAGVRHQVPGRVRPGHQPTAPPSSSGTATARPTSSGTSTPTAPSPACSPGCAWTRPAPPPPTARRSCCGPATAAPTRSGTRAAEPRTYERSADAITAESR